MSEPVTGAEQVAAHAKGYTDTSRSVNRRIAALCHDLLESRHVEKSYVERQLLIMLGWLAESLDR